MRKNLLKKPALISFLFVLIFFPFITSAALNSFNDVLKLIEKAATWLLSITVAIAVIIVVWGGFNFLMSGGDEKKVEEGRKRIIWGLVGVAVALVAKALVNLVGTLLG